MAISIKKVLIAIFLAGSFFAPWNFAQQLQIRSAIVIPGQVVSIPVEITPDVLGVHGYQFDLDVIPSAGAPVPTIESVNSGSAVSMSADLETQPGTPTIAPILIGSFVAFPPTDPIQSFDGSGSIADINFTIPLDATIGQSYQLELSDLTLVGASGVSIPVGVYGGILTVGSVTAFPDTLSAPADITVGEGQSQAVTATVTGDGHPIPGVSLQYSIDDPSIASLGASLVQTGSDGTASVNVTGLMDGTTTIRISAFSLGEVTVPVTVLGISPIITSTPLLEVNDGENYSYDVDAWDPNSDPITYHLTTSPADMTIDLNSGLIAWTPPAGQPQTGNDVTVEARDPSGNRSVQSFSIYVVKDLDNDGYESRLDCNDNDPLVNPGALEIPYDGIDNDCNPATRDDDLDGDGYLHVVDCDDTNAAVNPGATEVHYNLLDDDCDPGTLDYVDDDGDGYYTEQTPDYPAPADCDDDNPRVNPGADEIILNGIDDDCDAATPDSHAKTFVVMIDQGGNIYFAKSNGDGTFSDYKELEDIGAYSSRGIAIADFNNDGHLDFVAGGGTNTEVDFYLFNNDGSDNFLNRGIVVGHDVSGGWVYDMSAGDLNNDGNADFVSTTNSQYTVVAFGDGNGGFTSTLLDFGVAGGGVDLADLNSDGKLDLIRSQMGSGQIEVYIGQGNGSFDPPQIVGDAGGYTYGVVAADFDNDGVVDIFANNSSTGDATFFKGFGDGTFLNMGIEASLDPNNFSAYDGYDYNDDGNVDVVLTDHTGRSLWYYPGNGDSTFDSRVEINPASTTTHYVLAVSAPPYRAAGMPYAIIRPNPVHLPLGGTVDFDGSDSNDNDDGGVITSYEWELGDGGTATGSTVTYTYGVTEEHYLARLKVTDDEGKMAYGFAQVYIEGSPPVANSGGPYTFGEEVAANGIYTVTLDGSGSTDDQGIETYAWDFDDSDGIQVESTDIAPVHAYDAVGIYNVTLTVTDHARQQDTVTTTVTITRSIPPDAQHGGPYTIGENAALGGTWTLNLDASASSDDVGIEKYEWDLDAADGFQVDATGVAPEVTYTVPGDYTVTLRVYDHALQMTEVTTTVSVVMGAAPDASHGGPYAQTEDNAVGGNWSVTLDASASTDDSGIFLYEWDFDASDGIQVDATGEAVDVIYTSVGDYTVTVRVYDNALQMTEVTTTVSITAGGVPVADAGGPYEFDESDASHGIWTVNLDGTGSTDDIAIYKYEWFLEPTTFDFAGTVLDNTQWIFSVTDVTQNDGVTIVGAGSGRYLFSQADSLRRDGTTFQARILPENTSGNQAAAWGFKNTSANYHWNQMTHAIYFTNNSIRILEDGSNRGTKGSYTRNTLYDIKIVLKDQGAGYYFKPATSSTWTLLYDSDYSSASLLKAGVTVLSGTFRLDELIMEKGATTVNPDFRFKTPGTYAVTLTVKDNALQADSNTTTIDIVDGAPPVANAGGPYTAEVGGLINFDGTSSTDDNGIETYDWTFGDSTGGPAGADLPYKGKGATPRHIYRQVGTYNVDLTVTDNTFKSDADSTTVDVIVGNPPVANAGDPSQAGVNGPPAYFDGAGSTDDYGIVEYRWDFYDNFDSDGDGDSTNDIDAVGPNTFHIYTAATGTYFNEPFDGTVIDSTAWLTGGATQDDKITITGGGVSSGWGGRYIFSTANYDRGHATFQGQVLPVNLSGLQDMAWGVKNDSIYYGHYHLPHGIYFGNGDIRVYENGINRGTFGAYTRGLLYDVRIVLKGAEGASYFIKEASQSAWTKLHDSAAAITTTPLKIGATLLNGTFEFDNFSGGIPDSYVATLTVEDGAGQTSVDSTTVSVAPNLPPDVITVPWVAHDPTVPHETYNGKAVRLKGIVRDADPATFQWDFGDGSQSAVTDVTDSYDLSVTHLYPNALQGTPFVATLTVWDSLGQSGSDTYNVVVKTRDQSVETNIAIDEGLWYIHQLQTRTTDSGYRLGNWTSGNSIAATASSIQAFEVNGHFEGGDNRENPYVETVDRGFKYLFTQMASQSIGVQAYGEPDTNGNGIGIDTGGNGVGYLCGMVMDAIASSGSPLTRTITGGADILRRSYFDILTDMADQYNWGQYDHDTQGGGWRYLWNTFSDNSAAQWGAIGLQAAEDTFGIPVPQWVKDRNDVWLNYSYNGTGFGYSYAGNGSSTTPSGLVQLAFDDKTTNDGRWETAEADLANDWNNWIDLVTTNKNYYAFFAFTKAMRLANPEPVVKLKATGLDWYNDPAWGLARIIIDDQLPSGMFQGHGGLGSWVNEELRTSWGVIILSQTLFVQPPVADAGRDMVWAVNLPLTLDGSGSFHPDPFRQIVKYEWDFDGDGVFDSTGSSPTVTHTYTDDPVTLPKTYTVVLRVTDNNVPAITDTDTVQVIIAVPPHPPISVPGGPYTCTQGLPCTLDGSGSFDIDPTDFIARFEWELDGIFPFDFGEATGSNPSPVFSNLGTFNVGLRVWDNAVLNDLDGDGELDEDERLSDQDFTTVTVVANLAPVADANGPYTMNEDDTVNLDGTGSYDPNGDSLTYGWDYNNDGVFDDASGPAPTYTGLDDGIYPVELQVSDGLLNSTSATSVTVSNAAPVVEAGPDQSGVLGDTIALTPATFTDAGVQDTHTATIDWGDGTVEPGTVTQGAGAGSVAGNHVYAADGNYTVTVLVIDDDGLFGSDSFQVNLATANVGPTANAGGPYTINEGQGVTLDGSGSIDPDSGPNPLSYAWDLDGDGQYDDATGVTVTLPIQPDNSSFTVGLEVSDGLLTATDTATVTVNNVTPSVDAGADQTANEGDTVNLAGSFTDPGTADTHTIEWNFGDGSAPVGGSLTPSHAYADNGVYTVTLTVTDKDGGVGTDTLTVTVGNVAPVVAVPAGQTVTEGGTVTLPDASFTDAGAGDTHTATIDWGDGTVEPGTVIQGAGSGSVALGSHTYAEDGIYTVTVSVTDDDGAAGSNSLTITVNNAAPVVEAGPDQSGAPGGTIALVPATFTDAGVEDIHTATIDWGDGTTEAGAVTQGAGGGSVAGSHAYAADGNYTVTVLVIDDDGLFGSDSFQVNLTTANVGPAANAGGPYTINEGQGVTLDGSGSNDPDSGPSPLSYAWDLDGDGQYDDATGITVTLPIQPDNTSFTVGLEVSDGLLTATDTATVTVNNVAPTANAGPDQTINEGDTVNFAGSFADPGSVDTHTVEWNFGDGSATVSGSLTPSHVYADNGIYTVILTVTDKDGGVGTDTLTVTVGNVAPVVVVPAGQTITEGGTATLPNASFTDAGAGDTHTATIDWGDGTVEPGTVIQGAGSGSVALGSHTYAEDGIYTVTVSVTDDDGAVGTDSLTITVNNAAPVVEAGPDQSGAPGGTIALVPATFTDAGVEDIHTATIDWGDGTIEPGAVTQGAGGGSVAGSHAYAADGNYTVTVLVIDDDGLFGSDSFQVNLTTANVGPTANAGGPYTINEGQGVTLDGSGSNDPDSGPNPLSYAWDLDGDGQHDDATGVTVTLSIQPDNSSFIVGLEVSDGLLTATDAATVTVNNVVPTVDAGADQMFNEGDTANFSGSFSDPGSVDTHTIEWNFGDGATDSGSLTPSHTYPTAGVYTVTLTVTDKDGGIGSDTLTVTVQAGAVQTIFNLSARAKPNEVFLTWAPVLGADSYNVYRSTISGGAYTLITSGYVCDYCAYYDPGLTNGATYFYVVTSVSGGSESLSSNEAAATPQERRSRSRR